MYGGICKGNQGLEQLYYSNPMTIFEQNFLFKNHGYFMHYIKPKGYLEQYVLTNQKINGELTSIRQNDIFRYYCIRQGYWVHCGKVLGIWCILSNLGGIFMKKLFFNYTNLYHIPFCYQMSNFDIYDFY